MIRTLLASSLLLLPTVTAAPIPIPDPTKDRDGLPLPKGAIARLGSLIGYTPEGYVTFSGDGKQLLTLRQDALRVWDADTGRPVRVVQKPPRMGTPLAGGGGVSAMRVCLPMFARSGIGGDAEVKTWAMEDGRELASFTLGGPLFPYSAKQPPSKKAVTSTHFTEDGRTLLAVQTNVVELYDTETGKRTARVAADVTVAHEVAVSAGGTTLFVVDADKPRILRWDLAADKSLPALEYDGTPAHSLVVSGDGKWAVTRGAKSKPNGPNQPAPPADIDTAVRVWDLANGKVARSVEVDPAAKLHRLGADGLLVSGGTGVRRINLTDGKTVWERPFAAVKFTATSLDGHRVAVVGTDNRFRTLDGATGKPTWADTPDNTVVGIPEFSADGRTVSAFNRSWEWVTWSASGVAESRSKPWHAAPAPVQYPSPSARLLATQPAVTPDAKPEWACWDPSKREPLWKWTPLAPWQPVWVLDDARLLVERKDGAKRHLGVRDMVSGKLTAEWQLTDDPKVLRGRLSVGADGKTVLVGGPDLVGFDIATGKETFRIPKAKLPPVDLNQSALRLTPDGKRVVVPGNGVTVIDVGSHEAVAFAKGVPTSNTAVAASGKLVAAFNLTPEGDVRRPRSPTVVVDLATGRERSFPSDSPPTNAALSPDGTKAVVAYSDGTALIWDLTAK